MATFEEPVDIHGGHDLSIHDAGGNRTVHLTGEGALGLRGHLDIYDGKALAIRNANGEQVVHATGEGQLGLGGDGIGGGIQVYNSSTDKTVDIDGERKELSIYDAGGTRTVHLTGEGQLGLGGIQVYNTARDKTIDIDGETGDITLLGGDCAELFEADDPSSIEPGTVMVVGEGERLWPCAEAYDRRVAGIVSGAGGLRPGVVLGSVASSHRRLPIALTGRAYCKADARFGAIEVGDLLTTSVTPGHAMKAADHRAFGAVVGKALRSLATGDGLIPVLVALQ
jgi:hypothetical protein